MPAAGVHQRALLVGASIGFAAIFAAFVVFEHPGLGIAHFFYLPIALVGLATRPRWGAVAGVVAAGLYALGVLLNDAIPPAELVTVSFPIRLITYTAIGGLIGWFAANNRQLIGELRVLAERDRLTGIPNMRAFEAAVGRRLETETPFALLLGDMDALWELNAERGRLAGDELVIRLAETLGAALQPGEEVARVGGDEFAVLTSAPDKDAAARLAGRLEKMLASNGLDVSFGWAMYPGEGDNALGLVRVADERLYARKLMRGRRLAVGAEPSVRELAEAAKL